MGTECRAGCKVTEAEQRGEQDSSPASLLKSPVCPHHPSTCWSGCCPGSWCWEPESFSFLKGSSNPPSLPLLLPSVASSQHLRRCQANVLQRMTDAGIIYGPASWRAWELSSPKPPTDNHQWEIAPKVPRMLGAAAHRNTHCRAAERCVG